MYINLTSINGKLEQYAKSKAGKAKIASTLKQMQDDGLEQTAGGSLIISKKKMDEISDELISELRASAHSAGFAGSAKTVLEHFDEISKGELIKDADGSYRYELTFEGKTDGYNSKLARASLYDEKYNEETQYLHNIVALFNNGYNPGKPNDYVYGWWEGHEPTTAEVRYRSGIDSKDAWVKSTKDRPAIHFMQRAVDDFNAKYEKKYGIRAVLSEEYTNPNYYD